MDRGREYERAIGQLVIAHGELQRELGEIIGDFLDLGTDDLRSVVARLSFGGHIDLCEDLWDRKRGEGVPRFNEPPLQFVSRLRALDKERNRYAHATHLLLADSVDRTNADAKSAPAPRVEKVSRSGKLNTWEATVGEIDELVERMTGLYITLDGWRFKLRGAKMLPARLRGPIGLPPGPA